MIFPLFLFILGFHNGLMGLCELDCGSNIRIKVTNTIHNFTSPLFPKNYPRPLSCSWVFKTSNPNARVNFKIISFNLTRSHFCSADYFKVKDGPSLISPTLFNWCGQKPSGTKFRTSGNTALIFFSTLNTGQPANGFYMEFWEEEKEIIVERSPTYTSVHYTLAGLFAAVLALFVVALIFLIFNSVCLRKSNKITHSPGF